MEAGPGEAAVMDTAFAQIQAASLSTIALVTTTVVLTLTLVVKSFSKPPGNVPPHIPSSIPFLGHAISFGQSPIEFLTLAYQKYGPVFSFTMVGKTFTYLIGSDSAALFFNSKNETLNAEEVYSKLTTPVFGKGVAYDIPNPIFLEQKKMFKTGLNIARFRQHIPMIEEETVAYVKRWGDSGQTDIFKALSELIILTASRCLHGKEIRSVLDEKVAQLYWDLDGGFTPEAWLLPSWLPLPSFRKRDAAHVKVKQIFYEAIRKRKAGEPADDMLQTLIDSRYKSGRHLTEEEIAGMLIGLLLAGQHTSSTTSSWMAFFLAKNKDVQESLVEELCRIYGKEMGPMDYDGQKDCSLLENCMKETLRLRPPIMTMMRMAMEEVSVNGYTIPAGHQVCVSPTTNQRLPDTWENPADFDPDRFLDTKGATSEEKFSYIPFGAGRHRCIGESFAYVQIKVIMAIILRTYELDLVDGYFPEVNYTTMIHTPMNPIINYKKRVLSN